MAEHATTKARETGWAAAWSSKPNRPRRGRRRRSAARADQGSTDSGVYHRFAQFAQRFVFDLTDPFASQAQAIANLLERLRFFPIQTKAKTKHSSFALIHFVDQL